MSEKLLLVLEEDVGQRHFAIGQTWAAMLILWNCKSSVENDPITKRLFCSQYSDDWVQVSPIGIVLMLFFIHSIVTSTTCNWLYRDLKRHLLFSQSLEQSCSSCTGLAKYITLRTCDWMSALIPSQLVFQRKARLLAKSRHPLQKCIDIALFKSPPSWQWLFVSKTCKDDHLCQIFDLLLLQFHRSAYSRQLPITHQLGAWGNFPSESSTNFPGSTQQT